MESQRIIKYSGLGFTAIAFIYFFFNSFLLPQGLLYTTFLTPFFYYWLIRSGQKNVLGYFLAVLIPFAFGHFLVGVSEFYYLKTSIMYFTIYLMVFAWYIYLKHNSVERVFGRILLVNFIFTLVAIVLLFTPWLEWVWHTVKITIELKNIPRLKMLTYEPSYYSTLMVPIVLYYSIGIIVKKYSMKKIILILVMVYLPLILSFSLGVLSSLAFAFFSTGIYFLKPLMKKRLGLYGIFSITAVLLFVFIALIVAFPENPLFMRLEDLMEGKDHSGRGRTLEAWILSFQIIELTNYWIGCGLGQVKIMGEEVIRTFYHYQYDDIPIMRIPSSIGETISTFGIFGLTARLAIEIYLYYKTKVYSNYYRFAMFSYIFLYQFTGSYLTNVAEYIIWVIAFSSRFPDFTVPRFNRKPV